MVSTAPDQRMSSRGLDSQIFGSKHNNAIHSVIFVQQVIMYIDVSAFYNIHTEVDV